MMTQVVRVDADALAAELAVAEEALVGSIADGPEGRRLDAAVELLRAGAVVAFPTETVYGLAANALDSDAVARIFAAKGRPSDNPLIVHVSSIDMLHSLLPGRTPPLVSPASAIQDSSNDDESQSQALPVSSQAGTRQSLPPIYSDLIHRFWPGPLTILIPKSECVSSLVTAGHDTVAVRMPSHPVARALIARCGFPLAAPSANTSGRPSPTTASHVLADLNGRIPLIIDGGSCESGVESTVIDAMRPVPAILRPGGITLEQIRHIPAFRESIVYSKHFVDQGLENAPTTPGMKYRHYTPNADVVLAEIDDADPTSLHAKLRQRHAITAELTRIRHTSPDAVIGVLRTGEWDHQTSVSTPNTASHTHLDTHIIEHHLGQTVEQVAHNLFAGLRHLEQRQCTVIIIEGVSESDHGLAIMNRVRKAASRVIQ